jgi:hypothetical protein
VGGGLREPSQNNPEYAAMIESADTAVGRILHKIDSLGLRDRTVVVFTSDNGGLAAPEFRNRPATSNAPLREGKGHVYEGGIRVPLAVRWPDSQAGSCAMCPFSITSTDDARHRRVRTSRPHSGRRQHPAAARAEAPAPRRSLLALSHYSNQGGPRPGCAQAIQAHRFTTTPSSSTTWCRHRRKTTSRAGWRSRAMRRMLHDWRRLVDAEMRPSPPMMRPSLQRSALDHASEIELRGRARTFAAHALDRRSMVNGIPPLGLPSRAGTGRGKWAPAP